MTIIKRFSDCLGRDQDPAHWWKSEALSWRVSECYCSTFKRFKASSCHSSQIKRNKSQGTFIKTTKVEYDVVSTVTDRSDLSDEMAFMCAKLPIYRVKKTTPFSVMVKRKYYHNCTAYNCLLSNVC